jgi:hypothetical protein
MDLYKSLNFALYAALIIAVLATVWFALTGSLFIYYSLMALVFIVVLLMSVRIMQNSKNIPDITVRLREDAKGVWVINNGNARAEKIHIALVPLNIESDVPPLEPEEHFEVALPSMLTEAKAVVTFESTDGRKFGSTIALSSTGEGEYDPFKPVFPIFGYKK